MGIFSEKKKTTETPISESKHSRDLTVIERPRICCIDIDQNTINCLKEAGANVYNGSLGNKVKVANTYNKEHRLLLNFNFPKNLHEYDIILIDLNNYKVIDFKEEDYNREEHSSKDAIFFLSTYPETLFDPRPIACSFLHTEIDKIKNREFFVLAFSSESYEIEYSLFKVTKNGNKTLPNVNYNIYSFWHDIPLAEAKYGKEIIMEKIRNNFNFFLEKYTIGAEYNQTFQHPIIWSGNTSLKDDRYVPLLTNSNGDIVSYTEKFENKSLIILPQIVNKTNFILEFLSKIAPSIYPSLFPYSTAFTWKNDKNYWLPKHSLLLEEKLAIEEDFQKKIKENNKKTEENLDKFTYLHDIISETGDILTVAIIKYLKWLEFEDVKCFDETKESSSILEEDIQVVLNNGLLIIECKGIGGTSTDSDCSQISKIKYRRGRERKAYDVYALYIVNHQRYQPPLKRVNPPFSTNQIQDAINDERGLVTTWQLFNLYFEIEKGIITKEEARNSILKYGLIEFKPDGINLIYEPTEILKDGKVCIINIENILLKIDDEILVEKNGVFNKNKIVDIQDNGKSVNQALRGEIGLKFEFSISQKSVLWKKNNN